MFTHTEFAANLRTVRHSNLQKSPGQIAYEADVAACPTYHDGAPRPVWGMLDAAVQATWHRNPTSRF